MPTASPTLPDLSLGSLTGGASGVSSRLDRQLDALSVAKRSDGLLSGLQYGIASALQADGDVALLLAPGRVVMEDEADVLAALHSVASLGYSVGVEVTSFTRQAGNKWRATFTVGVMETRQMNRLRDGFMSAMGLAERVMAVLNNRRIPWDGWEQIVVTGLNFTAADADSSKTTWTVSGYAETVVETIETKG